MKFLKWLLVSVMFVSVSVRASEAILTIDIPASKISKKYSRQDLLNKALTAPLIMNDAPAYKGMTMKYKVVPAAVLFDGLPLPADAVIQFKTTDGFSAPVDTKKLMNKDVKGSIAYIAIEDDAHKWPPLKGKPRETAGPLYLIWQNPSLSDVREEEWPYQLSGFQVKGSMLAMYPDIYPDASLPENSAEQRGFKLFTQNCFACHTMNKNGESQIGPDLNLPNSPVEYISPPYLRMLIRNPQNVRHWPQGKMRGFSEKVLSDAELDDVIAYLKHMSLRKK